MTHLKPRELSMNTYCVILRPQFLVNPVQTRVKRCYLEADSAERAIVTALEDNPEWRVIGIEPRGMFAPLPQRDRSGHTPETGHAA
jgi:hypothetical protein